MQGKTQSPSLGYEDEFESDYNEEVSSSGEAFTYTM